MLQGEKVLVLHPSSNLRPPVMPACIERALPVDRRKNAVDNSNTAQRGANGPQQNCAGGFEIWQPRLLTLQMRDIICRLKSATEQVATESGSDCFQMEMT